MTIALLVCYDGTRLSGWQTQANADSVQSALERAVYDAFSENVRVAASGRTDSGVHAAGQVCSLSLENRIAPERVADALNRFLPEDVRVLESVAAPEGFDACRMAKRKTYRYRFYVSARQNPLKERYAAQLKRMPDPEKMRAAAKLIEGEHDFKCFWRERLGGEKHRAASAFRTNISRKIARRRRSRARRVRQRVSV